MVNSLRCGCTLYMLIDLIFKLCNATSIFEHTRKDTAKTTVRGDMCVLLTVLRIRLRIRIRTSDKRIWILLRILVFFCSLLLDATFT